MYCNIVCALMFVAGHVMGLPASDAGTDVHPRLLSDVRDTIPAREQDMVDLSDETMEILIPPDVVSQIFDEVTQKPLKLPVPDISSRIQISVPSDAEDERFGPPSTFIQRWKKSEDENKKTTAAPSTDTV